MKNFYQTAFRILCCVMILFITGCGGGSSGGAPTPSPGVVSLDTNAGSVANGATGVSLMPLIVLQFALPMVESSINNDNIIVSSSKNGDQPVTLTKLVANKAKTIFHFSTVNALSKNTHYYIVVKNTLAQDGSIVNAEFSFTTGAFTTPAVSLIDPENKSTGVPNTTTIQIHFSQNVQGVNFTNVQLHRGGVDGALVKLSAITKATDGTNSYIITIDAPLDYSLNYYLVLGSGITSFNGMQLKPTTFSFITARAPILYFVNFADQKVLKCKIDQFGVLIGCGDSGVGSTPFHQPFGISINDTGDLAYITNVTTANEGLNGVVMCSIDDHGDFTSCKDSGAEANSFSAPYGIALNKLNESKTLAYVTDFNIPHAQESQTGAVTTCVVDPSTHKFSDCVQKRLDNINYPKSIAFNNTHTMAYITNYQTETPAPFPSPLTITNSPITQCEVDVNGVLNRCKYMSTSADPVLSSIVDPFSVAIVNDVAYITSYPGANPFDNAPYPTIVTCRIAADGTFSNCTDQTSSYVTWSLGAIVPDKYNDMLYLLGSEGNHGMGVTNINLMACMNNGGQFDQLQCSINFAENYSNALGFNSGAIRY